MFFFPDARKVSIRQIIFSALLGTKNIPDFPVPNLMHDLLPQSVTKSWQLIPAYFGKSLTKTFFAF
jgi:hypothetical protein